MNRKLIVTLIVSLFLIATISSLGFAEGGSDDDRSYDISKGDVQLFVEENGLIHVKETYEYVFQGEWNGVYRDIPLKSGESLKNIKVKTEGAYNSFQILDEENNVKRIKVFLYSNSEQTQKIANQKVIVTYEYDFLNVINLYDDIGALDFKLLGEYWDTSMEKFTATVHFKSNEGIKYWLNPSYYVENSNWNGNSLEIETKRIPVENYFEIHAAIPASQFNTEKPFYAVKKSGDGLAIMEKNQKEYEDSLNSKNTFYTIVAILMILSVIIPIGAYLIYGREPKISYDAIYEKEPPTDDSPAFVNAFVGKGDVGNVGMDGFQGTIMDLINRKYILIDSTNVNPDDSKKTQSKSLKLKIDRTKISELEPFEQQLMHILLMFEQNGEVDLHYLSSSLSNESIAKQFKERYDNWGSSFKNRYFGDEELSKFFIGTGSMIMNIYGIIGIIIGFIGIIIPFFSFGPTPDAPPILFYSGILLLIMGIISLALPQTVGGRWTEYGKEYHDKWMNFKKYLTDFSLIKEHPPESVTIWNNYLVYASALGIADKVKKSMEMYVPAGELERYDSYSFYRYGGYGVMYSSFNDGLSTASKSESSSGSSGSSGGGSGGGGGGAF